MNPSSGADLSQPPIPDLIRYYDGLLAGDADFLIGLFSGEPHVNTPMEGEIRGDSVFRLYVSRQRLWLAGRGARARFFDIIITDQRIVVELTLDLMQAGTMIDLPVAMVAERAGDRIAALRVYHSTWPLNGHHTVRAPILTPPTEPLDEPAVITAYMHGIGEPPDKDAVLALFTEDGYAREPSGQRFKHIGREGLEGFYGPALQNGGIVLTHCTATWDGTACAIEFIAREWAHVKLPPQAGMAVYETAEDGTKLCAARIYDDVTPPYE